MTYTSTHASHWRSQDPCPGAPSPAGPDSTHAGQCTGRVPGPGAPDWLQLCTMDLFPPLNCFRFWCAMRRMGPSRPGTRGAPPPLPAAWRLAPRHSAWRCHPTSRTWYWQETSWGGCLAGTSGQWVAARLVGPCGAASYLATLCAASHAAVGLRQTARQRQQWQAPAPAPAVRWMWQRAAMMVVWCC
jgi:hypothetical protein